MMLAARVLDHPATRVVHVSEPVIKTRVRDLVAEAPEAAQFLNARWLREIS